MPPLGPLLFPFQYRFLQSSSTYDHMAWHDMALVPLPAAGNNRCHQALPCSELEKGQRHRGGGLSTEQPLFGHCTASDVSPGTNLIPV